MLTLSSLAQELAVMTERYQRESGQLELLQQQLQTKNSEFQQAQEDIEVWKQVQILLGKVSGYARQQLKMKLERIVTAALQAIYNDDSEFIIYTKDEGKPEARWVTAATRNGMRVYQDPEDGDGGGALDVVCLALKAALLELSRPKPGGPFLLDEPGKMIDGVTVQNLVPFIKGYLKQTNRQGIMITHHETLMRVADLGYHVRLREEDNLSEVEEVTDSAN